MVFFYHFFMVLMVPGGFDHFSFANNFFVDSNLFFKVATRLLVENNKDQIIFISNLYFIGKKSRGRVPRN